MFLDDKLYQHAIKRKIDSLDDYKEMINELYKICEDHFKPQLDINMGYRKAKIILDRTFNSWDLFINRLEKEDYFLVDIIKDCSYKSAFMENPKLVKIYMKGKN